MLRKGIIIHMDSDDSILLWAQAYLMPVMDHRGLKGLIVRHCEKRPGHYRRIGWWSTKGIGYPEDENVRDYMFSAREEDKVTIILI